MSISENKDFAVPFDRAYWVVPGKLLAGCYPGDDSEDVAIRKLSGLLNHGIRHFVSLMEPDECDHSGNPFNPYEPIVRSIARAMNWAVSFKRMPIRDLDIPTESEMIGILNHIDEKLNANMPTYVHCWGGRGRTGTVVGCYLARHGIAVGSELLGMLQGLRKNVPDFHLPSPETEAQVEVVVSWGNEGRI